MQKDYAASLLRSGIIEAKAGQGPTARRYLERAISVSGDHEVLAEAWYWLGQVVGDPAEKRAALENCISHNLRHARARRELALLDGKLNPDELIDPDALPRASTDPAKANADRFMCPKCGAKMAFAPDGMSLVCEYCTRNQTLHPQGEAEEQDFLIAMATARGHRKPVAMQVFHCQGCGAEFILPPQEISVTCAYCESPHVVSLKDQRELLQPDGILPHAFNQSQADRLVADWLHAQNIPLQGQADHPRGVYLPVWTFDIGGEILYSGDLIETESELGLRGQRVIRVKDGYAVHIDDLPVPASRKIARHLADLLPSFELKNTQPYDPRYLANWPAEVYDVPMADASLDARSRAYARLKRKLPGKVASLYNLSTSSAGLTVESFKLVLAPVWIIEIPARGRDLLVLINGQNGVVQGDKPARSKNSLWDWLRDALED